MRRKTPRAGLMLFALAIAATFTLAGAATASARAWLGVVTQDLSGELRDGLDLHSDAGVLVSRVVPGSPADRAGLHPGDVIVRYNSRAVESPESLQRLVGDSHSGQDVALDVVRHGRQETLSATLAPRPEEQGVEGAPSPPDAPEAPEAPPAPGGDEGGIKVRVHSLRDGEVPDGPEVEGNLDRLPPHVREMLRDLPERLRGLGEVRGMAGMARGRLGVRIQSLDDDLAAALGAPDRNGVLVLGVTEDTPASRAGLRAGDVITGVNGKAVKNAEELVAALRDVDGKASLSVSRKGDHRTVEAELGPAPRTDRDEGRVILKRQGRMGGSDQERPRMREDAGGDDLRQQVDELRQQLRELRKQLEGLKHE